MRSKALLAALLSVAGCSLTIELNDPPLDSAVFDAQDLLDVGIEDTTVTKPDGTGWDAEVDLDSGQEPDVQIDDAWIGVDVPVFPWPDAFVWLDASPDTTPCIDLDLDGYGDGCLLGLDCNDSDRETFPGALERCDGLDQDCDGSADEELVGCCDFGQTRPCGLSIGICEEGTQRCTETLSWSVCEGGILPVPETCNSADDDCDGVQDEGFPVGAPCSSGVGACAQSGYYICDGSSVICDVIPLGPTEESCDGTDNNCDGIIDNIIPTTCFVGVGACSQIGQVLCLNDFTESCSATPLVPSAEICNGIDDDCDGVVDGSGDRALSEACFAGPDTARQRGICHDGRRVCSNGQFGNCVGQILPTVEQCNGLDDNCNGIADDGLESLGSCVVGIGSCERQGHLSCINQTITCVGNSGTPSIEMCNGQDDNCDGQIDNQPVDIGTICTSGSGSCERTGQLVCINGSRTCNVGSGPSVPEICNGIDDDCDGVIDDNPGDIGASCNIGLGDCRASGTMICQQATLVCNAVAGTPINEICDNRDNDCDGSTDESLIRSCYTGPNGTAGVGLCRSGQNTCNAGIWSAGCSGQTVPAVETCNGQDDDCDGNIDDVAHLGDPCVLGQGACQGNGIQICDNATGGLRCNAVAGVPQAETCNNIDDDCDGSTDENLANMAACTVGLGACARSGVLQCVSGSPRCSASPGASSPERCNGIDDNCDGLIDNAPIDIGACTNGLGICTRTGQYVCSNGVRSCNATPGPSSVESCNNLDDDCDGIIDNHILGQGSNCTVGIGACQRTGQVICNGNQLICSESPGSSALESCNRIDDDCDGLVDDGPICALPYEFCDGTVGQCNQTSCYDYGAMPVANLGDRFMLDTTSEINATEASCGNGNGPEMRYAMFVSQRTEVTLWTYDNTFDTILYVRAICEQTETEIGCDDDAGGNSASRLVLTLEPGLYYVFVDGYSESSGQTGLGVSARPL